MPRYLCLIQIEGEPENPFHTITSVTEDSDDPAALARRWLRRIATNRRRTLTIRDLRASVFDATRPGFERLVLRGHDDDDLETTAAVAIAQAILGPVPVHAITIPGTFAEFLEGTSALQDAPETAYVQLRALWAAAARRRAGRSWLLILGAAADHLEIIADCAQVVEGGGGEWTRTEVKGAQEVIRQINAALGEPHYQAPWLHA